MSDEQNFNLSDDQLERFLQGAKELSRLDQEVTEAQQKVVSKQQELVEAAWRFQNSDITKEPAAEPQPQLDPSQMRVALRDAGGHFLVSTVGGDVLSGDYDSMTLACPCDVWVLHENEIVRKFTVYEPEQLVEISKLTNSNQQGAVNA